MTNKFNVQDIHSEEVAETFDRLTEEDLATLLKDRDGFVDTGCPACHSEDAPHVFKHQSLNYRRCTDCETLYISPAPTEAQHLDYVVRSSAMAYWRDNMPEEMKKSRRPMYVDRVEYVIGALERLNIEPKSCLEIGAGNGEFAEELSERVSLERLCLLEPQDMEIDVPKVHIIKAGFDALAEIDETFDFIVAFELIEHLLEPDIFLKLIRNVLKPGAPLILSTPNEKSVETRVLERSSSNILFDHVRLYNPDAMTRLLERNGFKVVEIQTPGQLDVERLKKHFLKHPEALEDQPALRFALTSGKETEVAFQGFLVDNHLSSHMRVVAVMDGEWNGEHRSILSKTGPISLAGVHNSKDPFIPTKKEPRTFNSTVLAHTNTVQEIYPFKLMHYILEEFGNIPSGRLMDLGGGFGHHGMIAQDMGYDVVSVDREEAVSGVSSVICDFAKEDIPLEDNSIDIVFSKSVIEHFYVRELPQMMSEVTRVLRPGGVFIALTPDWESSQRQFFSVFTHVTPYTVSSMSQFLRMYGFDNVRSETMMQLPSTWNSSLMKMLADITQQLPLPRRTGKWVRWSKERLLVGVGFKPQI